MTTRRLILNADDCNLTPGATRGILEAHDEGILTSTTVLINRPLEEKTVRQLLQRKRLGVGVHLNVTLGKPLTPTLSPQGREKGEGKSSRSSLVNVEGVFFRPSDYARKPPRISDVIREYDAQVQLFQKRFGRKPDHLDTHHHLHDHPLFFEALSITAKKWKVPVRRSRIFLQSDSLHLGRGVKTTDYLFGNLEARFYWQKTAFLNLAETLPEGASEIGCHPAFCDKELRRISSFHEPRERELILFSDSRLRKILSDLGIESIRFSDL